MIGDSVSQKPGTGRNSSVVAGIPAFNEARYIGSIVLQTKQYAQEVIVVDDGSADDTARMASLAGATVIQHEGNRGKGAAIQSIMAEAKRRKPDILILLDGDSQHDPNDIPTLARAVADGYDLVIGSREAQKDRTRTYRRIGQRVLSYAVRILSKSNVSDSQSGFRALSAKAIAHLQLQEEGFGIESEMIAAATKRYLKITEVPISNIYTADGSTFGPVRLGVGILTRVMAMIAQERPLLFYGLTGSILLAIGLAIGIGVFNTLPEGGTLPTSRIVLTGLLIVAAILALGTGIILSVLRRRRQSARGLRTR